ncbi:MAG: hypothetical protein VZT48_11375, partial [Bulleidia sp.]|nr:hypothetical protein [Bulleidia sp.]
YMDKKENPTQNEYVETVDTALALAKQNPLVRRSYMEYRQMIEDEREEAKQEGINLGRKEGIDLGRKEGKELGRKEGIDLGRKEGKELGRKEGIDLGRKEGVELERTRLICQLANSMSTDEIAEKLSMDIKDVQSAIAYGKTESTGTGVIHGVQTDDRG